MGKFYVVYKNDEIIATGTLEEVSQQLGVSTQTVQWYASPSARRGETIAEVNEIQ